MALPLRYFVHKSSSSVTDLLNSLHIHFPPVPFSCSVHWIKAGEVSVGELTAHGWLSSCRSICGNRWVFIIINKLTLASSLPQEISQSGRLAFGARGR